MEVSCTLSWKMVWDTVKIVLPFISNTNKICLPKIINKWN